MTLNPRPPVSKGGWGKIIGGDENEKKRKKNIIIYLDGSYGVCVIASIW